MERKLSEYLTEKLLMEGGIAGHMKHPIDYYDFTGEDLVALVDGIFTGKIEHIKEKLDGTNINAYRNTDGEVRFIRNQTDLNSEKGGMSIAEMSLKWAGKPSVAKVFTESGKTIEQVLVQVPVKFFNPDENTKVIVNCECILAGQTNLMVYGSDRVAFHGTSTYTRKDGKWTLADTREGIPAEISKAAMDVRGTEPRPDLVMKSVETGNRLSERFSNEIRKIFEKEGLSTSATIDELLRKRFSELCPEWLDPEDVYRRWFYGDRSVRMSTLKSKYGERYTELSETDKRLSKEIVQDTIEPLDTLFGKIGNELIGNLAGFTNSGIQDEVSRKLDADLDGLIRDIRRKGTADEVSKLERQLQRLKSMGDTINAAEGVVFTYKGRLMKLTGSFSALNQIMGMRKFSR